MCVREREKEREREMEGKQIEGIIGGERVLGSNFFFEMIQHFFKRLLKGVLFATLIDCQNSFFS